MALAAAGAIAVPLAMETRIARSRQPLTRAWKDVPLAPRGATLLGISFRPFQVEAFGLDRRATLERLLAYPFQLIRLGAYWSRIEPQGGEFDTSEFDWAIEAAERAGRRLGATQFIRRIVTRYKDRAAIVAWRPTGGVRQGSAANRVAGQCNDDQRDLDLLVDVAVPVDDEHRAA